MAGTILGSALCVLAFPLRWSTTARHRQRLQQQQQQQRQAEEEGVDGGAGEEGEQEKEAEEGLVAAPRRSGGRMESGGYTRRVASFMGALAQGKALLACPERIR